MEKLQQMIDFDHDNDIDILKFGCTLPNLANICLHKSTDTKFSPFTQADRDLLEKVRENVVGGPSIVFFTQSSCSWIFFRYSTNMWDSIVLIDASQQDRYSICQPGSIGLYRQWDLDPQTIRFKLRQNKTFRFESMVRFSLQRTRPDCKIKNFSTTGRENLIASALMVFVLIATLWSNQWAAFTTFFPVKKIIRLSPKRIFNVVVIRERERERERESSMNWEEAIYEQKASLLFKCGSVIDGDCTRQTKNVKKHNRDNFLHRRSLAVQQIIEKRKNGKKFGNVQCDIDEPQILPVKYSNLPPIFRNTLISKNDIGDLMKAYAEKEGILPQPQKNLILSFTL